MTLPDRCPVSGCDLRGAEIRPQDRDLYARATHYSRAIGEIERDRVVRWRCPDCGAVWEREP